MGLAGNFKTRFRCHKSSLANYKETGNTTLSSHYWKEKEEGKSPVVTWSILERGLTDYNPTSRTCRLCLREKFVIVFNPEIATLNSRQEMFAACRHKRGKLLGKAPG